MSQVQFYELAAKISDELMGTYKSLDDALEEFGLDIYTVHPDVLWHIDQNVACCDSCNWWVDSCGVDSDGFCSDCSKEKD